MKTIGAIGYVLAAVVGLAGLIVLAMGIADVGQSAAGLALGATILGSDFVFIVLLALLNGVTDIRDRLKVSLRALPAPVISALSPNSYACLNRNQTMTIDGSNFGSGMSLIFVNPKGASIESMAQKLTFVSSSQLIYQFNNGGEWVGAWNVRVHNPDGQDSNPFSFTVTTVET